MKRVCLWALAAALLAGSAVAQQKPPSDSAKWFVERNKETGQCWTSLLIQINGQYRHGNTHLAGGPYDDEAKASERIKVLAERAVCADG